MLRFPLILLASMLTLSESVTPEGLSLLQTSMTLQKGPIEGAGGDCDDFTDELLDGDEYASAAFAGVSLMQKDIHMKKGPVHHAELDDEDEMLGLMDAAG